MAEETTKRFNAPLNIKITGISVYNEQYNLIHYRVYGHDLDFFGLVKKQKLADAGITDFDAVIEADKVWLMFGNGVYVNYLKLRTGF